MYAVIFSGGKQYRVQEGDVVKLETLVNLEEGSTVNFDKILLIGEGGSIKVGSPYIEGCKVSGTVTSHGRHKKIRIVKFRRRKHQLKWQGHRQNYTEVKITQIEA